MRSFEKSAVQCLKTDHEMKLEVPVQALLYKRRLVFSQRKHICAKSQRLLYANYLGPKHVERFGPKIEMHLIRLSAEFFRL